jgi:oxygen-independent coproporphyrinogen III oxidase
MTIMHPAHLALWLGQPAPRYTSYPPATQFRPYPPVAAQANLPPHLAEIAQADAPISLYVHIPFCRSLCLFCGCHQVITQRAERMTAYLEALHHEVSLVHKKLGARIAVSHLHFGGGSPSTLKPTQLNALMDALEGAFDILPSAERAMELDPRTTTPDLVAVLAARGFNRASLGVQDFNAKVQEVVHRVQPFELVQGVMESLRRVGITAPSLDLMYGLPHQTPESLTFTAQQAVSLKPARVSLFSYAHVPGFKTYQKALEQAGLPSDEDKLLQERAVREVLREAGYVAIGIDHFALPSDPLAKAAQAGTLGRNFQGYTDDDASYLLGLGASAISDVVSEYVQNEPDIEAYQAQIAAGQLPLKRRCNRTAEDHRRGAVIKDLMCNFTAELGEMSDLADAVVRLQPFIETGLVTQNGSRITVDRTYPMAVRAVAACFDATYNPAKIGSRVA